MDLQKEFLKACIDGDLESLKKINIDEIDINFDNGKPIVGAIYNGHVDILNYLVEHGADVNLITEDAIRWAKIQEYFEVIDCIEEAKEKASKLNILKALKVDKAEQEDIIKAQEYLEYDYDYFDELLELAAKRGYLNTVIRIFESDYEPYIDLEGSLAIENAAEYGHKEVLKFMLAYSSFNTTLIENALAQASYKGQREIVEYLVDECHADAKGSDNQPIILAARNGNFEIVELLIDKGVDEVGKNFALEEAAEAGSLEIVQHLIEKEGCSVKGDFEYALGFAAAGGHLKMVEYLLKQEANIHANQDIALQWAAKNGHLEIVKYLEKEGANLEKYGTKAFKLATDEYQFEVMKYLATKKEVDVTINNNEALKVAEKERKYDLVNVLKERISIVSKIKHKLSKEDSLELEL